MSDWSEQREFDAALLDLHLGRLGADERAAVLARVAADPALARQHALLTGVFTGLAALPAPVAPSGLLERIGRRIADAPTLRVAPPPASSGPRRRTPPAPASAGWIVRIGNLRDLVATAAILVFMVGLGVPALLQVRERSQRIACSANLARVGQGLAAYATTFGSSLPFAGWGTQSSWQPTSDPRLQTVENRRHVYRLLPAGLVPTRFFVCPSSGDAPMPADQVPFHSDFLESRNLSYAYQNMAGVRPTYESNPDLPVLADDNPAFDDGRPLLSLSQRLRLVDPARANSRAHGDRGQNILTLGGRVKWTTTPNVGLDRDNIWTLRGIDRYTGREGPQTATDSHLIK
ncbi:MAG: hypothetical protein AB7Q17_00560 [Phycisphaerae bacterium]